MRFAVVALLALALPALHAQTPSADLATLQKDLWEDQLKHSPEFASAIGDRRYNDQLSDLSPRAYNNELAAHRDFLARLAAIDTAHLTDPEKLAAERLQLQFVGDEQAAILKLWQQPLKPTHGMPSDLSAMATTLPFETVKDYDDYITRLHLLPAVLRQASEDLLSAIDDNRIQPAPVIQKALTQTEELAAQTPEASPFAVPLKHFPASVDEVDRKRIAAALLETIKSDVQPAFVRFARFLRAAALPAAAKSIPAPDLEGPWKGETFAYKLEQRKILELRAKAASQLGAKFDLKGFHDQVVSAQTLPIDALEQRINAWIAASK